MMNCLRMGSEKQEIRKGFYYIFKVAYFILVGYMILVSTYLYSLKNGDEGGAIAAGFLASIGFLFTYIIGILKAILGAKIKPQEVLNALLLSCMYGLFFLSIETGIYPYSINEGILIGVMHLILIIVEIYLSKRP